MNCKQTRDLFSARLDGELSATDQQATELHTQDCAECAAQWLAFENSIGALRGMGVREVSDRYVDTLVAGALGSAAAVQTPPNSGGARRLSLASHGLAVLLGAAAAVLLFWLGGFGKTPEPLLVKNGSNLQTGGPGGSPSSGPVAEVAPPATRVEIEYVDRIVERVEYVSLPAVGPREIRNPVLERAVLFSGAAFLALRDELQAQRTSAPLNEQILAESAHEIAPTPEQNALAEGPTRAQRRRAAALPNSGFGDPVVIRREGVRLSLETYGTLDEVVPALIAQISNADPQVSALVQDQLREIWSARTGKNWNEAPFGVEPELAGRDTGWNFRTSRKRAERVRPDPVQEWSSWWATQGTSVAQLGM